MEVKEEEEDEGKGKGKGKRKYRGRGKSQEDYFFCDIFTISYTNFLINKIYSFDLFI